MYIHGQAQYSSDYIHLNQLFVLNRTIALPEGKDSYYAHLIILNRTANTAPSVILLIQIKIATRMKIVIHE